MQSSPVSSEVQKESGLNRVRKLPDAAICRAKPARWPGVVACLVQSPAECKHAKYFNEVAYGTHPQRKAIIARTKAGVAK